MKRPVLSLIIALLLLAGAGVVVWRVPPNLWSEPLVITAFAGAAFTVIGWITGSAKRAGQLTVMTVGLMLMQRLRILGWVTGGLWVAAWGLIALIS